MKIKLTLLLFVASILSGFANDNEGIMDIDNFTIPVPYEILEKDAVISKDDLEGMGIQYKLNMKTPLKLINIREHEKNPKIIYGLETYISSPKLLDDAQWNDSIWIKLKITTKLFQTENGSGIDNVLKSFQSEARILACSSFWAENKSCGVISGDNSYDVRLGDESFSYALNISPIFWYSQDKTSRYGVGYLSVRPYESKYEKHKEKYNFSNSNVYIQVLYRQSLSKVIPLSELISEPKDVDPKQKLEELIKKRNELGEKYKEGKATLDDIGKIQRRIDYLKLRIVK